MFVFVFHWTPVLEASRASHADLPHGLVFASFMVAMMIGSTGYKLLLSSKPAAAVPEACVPPLPRPTPNDTEDAAYFLFCGAASPARAGHGFE